jgi:RecB family exonuclease
MPDVNSRTLIRARDLAAFRQVLIDLALEGGVQDVLRRVIVVPTRAAAELLRQSIEGRLGAARPSAMLPAVVTRDEWIARLHDAIPGRPRMLSRIERELLLERAARRTAARPRVGRAPFHLRPGLAAALLDFYDELGRRQRTVRRFARALFDQLRVERGTDRGSESLLHQTAFMGLTFLAYERGVAASGALDEHALRQRLIASPPPLPFDHVVIAVADHPSDPRGLWPADFALIGRLGGLSRVDVVVTEETHDAGFRERVERELPGIVERRHASPRPPAVIVRPPAEADGAAAACFISRDREEELRTVAQMIRRRAARDGDALIAPVAVVVHRPLPYLFLAPQVLADAGVPFEAFDAVPLAAEPYAAMLDLVMTFARTGGTREAAAALLRCGLLRFEVDGAHVGLEDVAALTAALAARRASGTAETYSTEVEAWFDGRAVRDRASRAGALRAARAAAAVRAALDPYRGAPAASAQVRVLSTFIRRHEILPAGDDQWRDRHLRARAAVLGVLDELAAACARHDDAPRDNAAVTAAIRHALEARVFTPRRGSGGVQLVDAAAARFGEFDHVHLVGLVDSDWPERTRRSIFFTSGLLAALGWPQEADDLRAQQAAFRDLLGLAARTTTLHAFQLEGETVTTVAPGLAMLVGTRYEGTRYEGTRYEGTRYEGTLPAAQNTPHDAQSSPYDAQRPPHDARSTSHEARSTSHDARSASRDARSTPHAGMLHEARSTPHGDDWMSLRLARPPLDDRRYRGFVAPRPPAAYRVSAVDRYVDCPFKYFAEAVLQLPDEREAADGLSPIERGTLVHDLFERFYTAWEAHGGGTITPATLPDALARFRDLATAALARLPEADRVLEEARLLGSIVARGLAERVFELESDAGGRIVRRLIEYELRGPFDFPRTDGLAQATIAIRGKADRIDVFDDGTLRVIDYKLGALPDLDSSIQIAVYAHAARQLLERAEGRPFTIGSAMYLAFGDDRRLEGRLGGRDLPPAMAVLARASEFAREVERIEAGEFPPRPRRPVECQWCGAAGVCRKEFAPDVDDAAEPV